MKVIQKSVMALAVIGVLAGCGRVDTGSVKLAVNARGSQARADQTYAVTVNLTGPSTRGPITLTQGAALTDPWTGTLDDLPTGVYGVTAGAVESPSGKVFTASMNCTVTKNSVALCALTLQQVGGTRTFEDTAPLISAISMSDAAPHYGEILTLAMTASFVGQANIPDITAFCAGIGETPMPQKVTPLLQPFPNWDNTLTDSVDLTSTCRTTETVVFSATDEKGIKSIVSITFPWQAEGLNLSATINHWPDIDKIASANAQVLPNGTLGLTVTASDLDGDPLTYKWSSDCGGTFDSAKVTNPTFTAPGALGACTLSVLVEDGKGGANTGKLTVNVRELGVLVHSTMTIHASGTEVIGVQAGLAIGWSGTSIQKVAVPACTKDPSTCKAEYYVPPADLFGHPVLLGDVSRISYWTKKATSHTSEPADWYIVIYTMPYSPPTAPNGGWYGARINTEPYFSENLSEIVGEFNQWSSEEAVSNSLRFYESTANTFGTSTDQHWTAFVEGTSLAGFSYKTQPIKYFSIQTSTSMEKTFVGQVAGVLIELKDGSTANIDFGP